MTPFEPAAVLRTVGPASSHGSPGAAVAAKSRFVELVLLIVSVFESVALGATLKLRAMGVATSIALELTYMLTGIVTGLFGSATPVVGFTPVIVTVPVQVVP